MGMTGMTEPNINRNEIIRTEILSDGRTILHHESDFTILLPEGAENWIPLDCPVCLILMRDMTDVVYYQKYQCCSDCAVDWAEPNRSNWTDGWRPDAGIVRKRLVTRLAFPSHGSITAQEE